MSSRVSASKDSSDEPAPSADEVEISIFGPGKGECIVAHVGNGDWVVVDSCRPNSSSTPVALEYLTRIGVDARTQVRLVVATHAHDDHFGGIADVFDACQAAHFVCSSAATSVEYLALVEIDKELANRVPKRAYAEYSQVFSEAKKRANSAGRPIRYADAGKELFRNEQVVVSALSPSDEAITRSREVFGQALVAAGERKRLPTSDPNQLAIAIIIEAGQAVALLGADLPTGPSGCGWRAVLSAPPAKRASLYKVAHHGSPTSHHGGIWTDLLTPEPVQVLAPFRSGRTPRPAPEDVTRLKALGPTYSSASLKGPTPDKAVKRLRAALTGVATDVRDPWGEIGQVRARCSTTESIWRVTTFHPATRL
jgi:beta-lactamase superfamily II metal-dependent hydrolase